MSSKKAENKLLAVIRVRGSVRVRQSILETLKRMNLNHVNNMVLVFANKSNMGMIKKCSDFVTFGEISKETLAKLFEKKGIKAEQTAVEELVKGSKSARDLEIATPIKMKPPKHGYEGIKEHFSTGGALGYRGDAINKLITRMM